MTTGRTPPPLEELTLSSGVTVQIRKVSPFTQDAIRAKYPAPPPPMVENDYGDGKIRREPNPADPDYLRALREHRLMAAEKFTEAMFQLGVVVEVDTEAVAAFRAEMQSLGIDLKESDHQIYVRHLAIRTDEDIDRLSRAIMRKSTPTEEAVQERLETFSGDVQRPRPDGDQSATVGG